MNGFFMIRLKQLLFEDNEIALPKTYAYKGHIVMQDTQTHKTYHYELYVDKLVDISVEIVKIDMKTREITYKHPLKGDARVSELKDTDVVKIAQQYKTTAVGESIEGMHTRQGDELYLKRIA